MRIWLIQVGEPVPVGETATDRLLRTGLLAQTMARQGHDVLWWSSTFDHFRKKSLYPPGARIEVEPNLVLRMLHGVSYPTNLSVRRIVNHLQLASHFRQLALQERAPDVLLASFPPVELAAAAVDYARRLAVPVAVDVRDLWPDTLVDLAPAFLRPLARAGLQWMVSATRRALASADAIVATSSSMRDWGLRYAGRPAGSDDAVIPLAYPRLDVTDWDLADADVALRALGVDPSKRIAWFIGSFGRSYDLSTVIAAARLMVDRTDLQFVLSGAGEQDPRWRAESAGLPNVVFTGWVDRVRSAYLLRAAWVGLAAYAVGAPQSNPNKVFEYMSGGLPVLSSLAGDTAVLLAQHHCGLSYAAGQPDDLRASLLALADDDALRRSMAQASRDAFTANYTAEAVYSRYSAFLVSLAGPLREAHMIDRRS